MKISVDLLPNGIPDSYDFPGGWVVNNLDRKSSFEVMLVNGRAYHSVEVAGTKSVAKAVQAALAMRLPPAQTYKQGGQEIYGTFHKINIKGVKNLQDLAPKNE